MCVEDKDLYYFYHENLSQVGQSCYRKNSKLTKMNVHIIELVRRIRNWMLEIPMKDKTLYLDDYMVRM